MSAVVEENSQTLNFYRPDYFVKTPTMRSPDYVQLSTAAAITLGLVPGVMHRTSCTNCLNLLMTYRKVAAPTAPTVVWLAIVKKAAIMPTATSFGWTGRRCGWTKCSNALLRTATRVIFSACASA
jgi:Biotin synthase-related enzyme